MNQAYRPRFQFLAKAGSNDAPASYPHTGNTSQSCSMSAYVVSLGTLTEPPPPQAAPFFSFRQEGSSKSPMNAIANKRHSGPSPKPPGAAPAIPIASSRWKMLGGSKGYLGDLDSRCYPAPTLFLGPTNCQKEPTAKDSIFAEGEILTDAVFILSRRYPGRYAHPGHRSGQSKP
jgi:hypothetical protein